MASYKRFLTLTALFLFFCGYEALNITSSDLQKVLVKDATKTEKKSCGEGGGYGGGGGGYGGGGGQPGIPRGGGQPRIPSGGGQPGFSIGGTPGVTEGHSNAAARTSSGYLAIALVGIVILAYV